MVARFLGFSLCIVFSSTLFGQTQFANRNDLLFEQDAHSGVPVGIADMNGDGLDDIVILSFGEDLIIQYQSPDPERPFLRYKLPLNVANNEQNDMCIADFNNDGANDIMMVGSYDRVKVIYSIPHTYEFTYTDFVVTPFFSQGASAGDFNHDGWVDVVMLNDNGLNYTLMNDGTGNLVLDDYFDFVTVPPSDNSGNYGSVYSDFDMDGDVDFYIAKCRQGVNSSTDPRRINALFVNDGSGNYTELAAAYGLASGDQTWTADFGDIDNDGDMDCFMTQHNIICEIFENIDNDTFINITATSGLDIGGVPLQGMLRDFDNDGFQDILVSGNRLDYFRNNGDKTFSRMDPFDGAIFGTFAMGDLNNDGFTDVYASTVRPFNNPDPLRPDILFLNEGNDNHYLGLRLTDTVGNPSAIGAMAILYGPWGTQIREVRGGEQYGVSSGHSIIFGLGQETAYDSLMIRWANGEREHYNGLTADTTWHIRRGGCFSEPIRQFDDLNVLCAEDSLKLFLTAGLPLIEWSTGDTADTLVVQTPGIYFATLLDINGCPVLSNAIEVGQNPDTIKPVITYDGSTELCAGEFITLTVSDGVSYLWSTGDTTQVIDATISGEYYVQVAGFCEDLVSDTISLNFLMSDLPMTTDDTIKLGESAILEATGDSIVWYADMEGTMPVGSGNSLQLDDLTDTTTFYAQSFSGIDGLDFQVGPAGHQGSTKYNSNFVNGGLLFEVYQPIILHQITLFTDTVGSRMIEIFNDDMTFMFQQEVYLENDTTVVDLDVEIPEGSYTMTTNTDFNTQEFGVSTPYLWRSAQNILFPYAFQDVMSITNSTFGSDYFYYFYNWKVSTPDMYCGSELVPATAFVELETGTFQPDPNLDFMVSPNPTDGVSFVSSTATGSVDIELRNMQGLLIRTDRNIRTNDRAYALDFGALPSGIYLIRVVQEDRFFVKKVVRL